MNPSQFLRQLALITSSTALFILGLHQFTALTATADFSWISLAFFVTLSIVIYFVGYRAVYNQNKGAFINAALGLTFFKMVLCIVLVGTYIKFTNPPTRLFILPFLGIYIIYTIFETHFMMKMGKERIG